jgi:hypothetical protein
MTEKGKHESADLTIVGFGFGVRHCYGRIDTDDYKCYEIDHAITEKEAELLNANDFAGVDTTDNPNLYKCNDYSNRFFTKQDVIDEIPAFIKRQGLSEIDEVWYGDEIIWKRD